MPPVSRADDFPSLVRKLRRGFRSVSQTPSTVAGAPNSESQVSNPATSIMIVAGERSGDIYGAGLARALRARLPGVRFFGCGGDAMRQADIDTVVDSHEIAIAGVTEIVSG